MEENPLITLTSCPKGYTQDLDKAVSPKQTIAFFESQCKQAGLTIVAKTQRVDCGRLGIPVFMSICGEDAKTLMPTRKQMGKGSSHDQAKASAIMELVERFSFFSFWQNMPLCKKMRFNQACELFGSSCIAVETLLESVDERLDSDLAKEILSSATWSFYPATNLTKEKIEWIPLDWFKLINEFNGSSAGNCQEESILQGLCELIERDVCARIDRAKKRTKTIDQKSVTDPTLKTLLAAFEKEGITLFLKDFTENMPIPTVGALAFDKKTLHTSSEIVFTAGTATDPQKAAVRAVTEVAQLAGDFCTNACYEASGLSKYKTLEEIAWINEGETTTFADMKSLSNPDICTELRSLIQKLAPHTVYTIETTHKKLGIPSNYSIIPGLTFRERDTNQCLGLFVGRKLVEEEEIGCAKEGLKKLAKIYPSAHFIPFFKGMLAIRKEAFDSAEDFFAKAIPLQPDPESTALTLFYQGYSATLQGKWKESLPLLTKAQKLNPGVKEYANLAGVAAFKEKDYAAAKEFFTKALEIDKGSAMDYANLGLCEKFLGEKERAVEHFSIALSLDPSIAFAKEHLESLSTQKT